MNNNDLTAANNCDCPGGQFTALPQNTLIPINPSISELATDVASLVSQYRELDSKINAITTNLLDRSAKLEEEAEETLTPWFAQLQSVLSQRGPLRTALRRGNLPSDVAAQLLEQIEELPGWTKWYTTYSIRLQSARSLRTIQRVLRKLHSASSEDGDGEANTDESPDAADDDSIGADDSGIDGGDKVEERAEIQSGAEALSEHASRMLDALTGNSIKSDSMRITRTVELVKDMQRAIDEGKLFSPAPSIVQPPSSPPILGEPTPEPDPGTLEELRHRLSRMADTNEIARTLQGFITEFVKPLVEHHTFVPTVDIKVTAYRGNGRRIHEGDWVEYRGGDNRLTKQVGNETALGRVVGEDKRLRPRLRWHNGTEWTKPYSLFLDCSPYSYSSPDAACVRVLFDYKAAERHPLAFACYPTDDKRKTPKRRSLAAPIQVHAASPDSQEQGAT